MILPDDAQPEGGPIEGPYRGTGDVAVVRHTAGHAVAYIYFFGWEGQAYFAEGGGTRLPNLQVLITGLTDIDDPGSEMLEGSVMVIAREDTHERVFEVAIGGVVYGLSLLEGQVVLDPLNPGFIHSDEAPIRLHVKMRAIESGHAELEEPLAYGTHLAVDGQRLQFVDFALDVDDSSRGASDTVFRLVGSDWSTSVGVGEKRFTALPATGSPLGDDVGLVTAVYSDHHGGAWTFFNIYPPGAEYYRPGSTSAINLNPGDRLDLPTGVFQLDSLVAGTAARGTHTASGSDGGVEVSVVDGEVLQLPELDTSLSTPVSVGNESIHFYIEDPQRERP